ncbi:hypothetical protein Tco_1279427 [Tanacetum coccineum]
MMEARVWRVGGKLLGKLSSFCWFIVVVYLRPDVNMVWSLPVDSAGHGSYGIQVGHNVHGMLLKFELGLTLVSLLCKLAAKAIWKTLLKDSAWTMPIINA